MSLPFRAWLFRKLGRKSFVRLALVESYGNQSCAHVTLALRLSIDNILRLEDNLYHNLKKSISCQS
jgi:hypothetical protein